MEIFAGAYATITKEPPETVEEYYSLLAAEPLVGGLEEPWTGAPLVDRGWPVIVTTIPGTMDAIAANPRFGLASLDDAGRAAAVADVAALRDEVVRLNDARGSQVVRAVELHSAPRRTECDSSSEALARSLAEIASWNWNGAELLVEHCDAHVAGQSAAKGFLSLDEEIAAVNGVPVGIVLNWGRSAIELRDADRVVEHIAATRDAGVLRGLIFSGAASVDGDNVSAWADQHVPVAREGGVGGERLSLLTEERMRAALACAGPVAVLGLKVGWRGDRASAQERAALVSRGLEVVERLAVG